MYPAKILSLMVKNSNDFAKKPKMPMAKAKEAITPAFFLVKYPNLKSDLTKKDPYLKSQRIVDTLTHDRIMWATKNKEWMNS